MQEEAAAQPEGEGEGAVLPPLNAASYNWLIHAFANATARDGSPMPLPVRCPLHSLLGCISAPERVALGVGQSNAEAVLERMSSQEPPVLPDAVRRCVVERLG